MTDTNLAEASDTEGTDPALVSDSRETTSALETPLPTKEELALMCSDIKTGFPTDVNVEPTVFNFKTSKVAGVETKRDSLELAIPYPTVQGIIDILEKSDTPEGEKSLELLMQTVRGVITQQARALITDDPAITALTFPADKMSWDFIANIPKAERSGGGIPAPVWDDFETDYVAVMITATGNEADKVARAAALLKGKLSNARTNIPVLKHLVELLGIYINNTKRADEFAACVNFLMEKADKLLNVTDEELLSAL